MTIHLVDILLCSIEKLPFVGNVTIAVSRRSDN